MMVMLVGSVGGVDNSWDSPDPFDRWCVFSFMGFSSLLTGFRAVTLTRAIPWRYSLDLETDILAAIIPCSTPDGFLLLYLLGGSTGDPEQTLQFWEVLETIRGCRTDADHWFLLGWVPHIRGLNWGREGTLWTLETVLWAWTEYYDGTTHYLLFGVLWIVDGRQHSCIPAVLQVYLSIQLIRVRWLLSCIILHLSHWCTPLIYILSVPKGVKHR